MTGPVIMVNISYGCTGTTTSSIVTTRQTKIATSTATTKEEGRSSAEGKSATIKPPESDTKTELPDAVPDKSKTSQASPPDCDTNGENDVLGACEAGRTSSALLTRQNAILSLLIAIIMLMRTY